jgi:hypothetical protein
MISKRIVTESGNGWWKQQTNVEDRTSILVRWRERERGVAWGRADLLIEANRIRHLDCTLEHQQDNDTLPPK